MKDEGRRWNAEGDSVTRPARFPTASAHPTEVGAVPAGRLVAANVDLHAPATPLRDHGIRRTAMTASAAFSVLTLERCHTRRSPPSKGVCRLDLWCKAASCLMHLRTRCQYSSRN